MQQFHLPLFSPRFLGQSNLEIALGILMLLPIAAGCSNGPGRVHGVDIDPSSAAESLLAKFDRNESGGLDNEELSEVPSVQGRFDKHDADKSSEITADELETLFARVFDSKQGLCSAECRVLHGGRPLQRATVKFRPADFLEGLVPVASGVTNSNGVAMLSIAADDLPDGLPAVKGLIRPGFYRVEVTHVDLDIPAEYNSETKIGKEVSMATINRPLAVKLKF